MGTTVDSLKELHGADRYVGIVGKSFKQSLAEDTPYDVKVALGWLFGQPEIRCDNEGWGQWESKALQAKFKDSYDTNRQFRYGNWAVHLNGGPQASGESWASVSVPVNELKVSDIESIAYDWYAHQLGTSHILDIGPNLVFSAYDPGDHSKRVDFNTRPIDNNIFMDDGAANRPIEAGWYKYLMTDHDATEIVFWYGNNTGGHSTAPTQGAQTHYWSSYVGDTGFKNWVVYRIQIMTGYWGSTRSTGDVWIGNMRINGIPVKWEPSEADKVALLDKEKNMFGKPTLISNNNSKASWFKSGTSPYYQKSSTGWLADLYGGVQTGDDWAGVFIPVNEMRVPDLKTALWSYIMSASDSFGVNMVVWVHDPYDFDNRAEITQRQQHADLEKSAGWNAHELNPSTDYFFFYGEGTTNTNLTAGTDYGWDDFVADELFNVWTIYRISFEFGWQASGTFGDAKIADIEINGQQIPLYPDSKKYYKTVRVQKTLDANGVYTAGDVMSEDPGAGLGTDWDFEFGGVGKIVKAIAVSPTTGLTAALVLFLYDSPPTCELDDHAASTGPLVADLPYYVGQIDFPTMIDQASAPSYTIATLADAGGGLPLAFDKPKLYGVLVDGTGEDFADDTTLDIILTAELEA